MFLGQLSYLVTLLHVLTVTREKRDEVDDLVINTHANAGYNCYDKVKIVAFLSLLGSGVNGTHCGEYITSALGRSRTSLTVPKLILSLQQTPNSRFPGTSVSAVTHQKLSSYKKNNVCQIGM
jgi:hypothetical protein